MKSLVLISALLFGVPATAGAATINVTTTLRVTSGTFDGGGSTYVAAVGLEDQSPSNLWPIFRVENGATLKNVVIGSPSRTAVHLYNGAILDNVSWTDVNDAAVVVKQSTGPDQAFTIRGGRSAKATDKVVLVAAPCTLNVRNHTSESFQTFLRQNPGTTYQCRLNVNDSRLTNGTYGIRTDSTTTTISTNGTTFVNVRTPVRTP